MYVCNAYLLFAAPTLPGPSGTCGVTSSRATTTCDKKSAVCRCTYIHICIAYMT